MSANLVAMVNDDIDKNRLLQQAREEKGTTKRRRQMSIRAMDGDVNKDREVPTVPQQPPKMSTEVVKNDV